MKKAIDSIWESIEKAKEIYSKNNDILFDVSPEKKASFDKQFRKTYKEVKDNYMTKDVIALDRHKVASIIICTIITENIISLKKKTEKNTIFLGSEMIALSIGLSYMQRSLNDILQELSIPKKVNGYYMPTAMACTTDYFDILARNLYFSKRDFVLNPLDLADKLFLIEYLTLKNEMIDPQLLINASIHNTENTQSE